MGSQMDGAGGQWIREAVRRFQGPLTLYATRILKDAEKARDAVQETFVRLCGQEPSRVQLHLAEWLFRVCRNHALDVRRKEKRMSLMPDSEFQMPDRTGSAPPQMVEERESQGRVLRLLDALPDNQQEVLRLKFQQGMSYKQISRITGFSETNVGFLIHTGLKTLRGKMSGEMVGR